MKKLLLLFAAYVFAAPTFSQVTISVSPDTVEFGDDLNILFSGTNLNFQQGTNSCQYLYFTQGSNTISYFSGTNLNVLNANQAMGRFVFDQGTQCGSFDLWLVDYCQGSGTSISFVNKLFLKCSSIFSGSVFQDLNNNGINDSEPPVRYAAITSMPENRTYYADYNGYYSVNLKNGNHQISVTPPPNYSVTTLPAVKTVNIQNDTTLDNNDFGLHAPSSNDLKVEVYNSSLRIGYERYIYVTIYNNGTTQQTPQVSLTLPSEVSVAGCDIAYSGTGTVLFTYPSPIAPMDFASFWVSLHTDVAAPFGATRTYVAKTVGHLTPDVTPSDNIDSATFLYNNSYDPNDKQVIPAGLGAEKEVLLGTELEYLIRFQNTGNDVAYNINVTDSISADLDLNTLKVLSTSHTLTKMRQTKDGKIVFYFDNINLPDSGLSRSGSNGFIRFKIKPKPGMANNTLVTNTAQIYFDFNSPVITNTTSSKFVQNYSGIQIVKDNLNIALYPNPIEKNEFTVSIANFKEENYVLNILDLTGKLVQTETLRKSISKINTADLSKGIYLVEIGISTATIRYKVVIK